MTIIKSVPDFQLGEGYSIGKYNPVYGTFEVMFGDRVIGRVGWHAHYYARYRYGEDSAYEVSISGYIKSENAREKCARMIVAFHKVVGDVKFEYGINFSPTNPIMTSFNMSSYNIKPIFELINFATVHRKKDGWYVKQLYGQLEVTKYTTAQEAINAATSAAKEKGKTFLYIAGEMIKAGWVKDKKEAIRVTSTWNKVQVNDDEPTNFTSSEVKNGDVIKWNGKIWIVKS